MRITAEDLAKVQQAQDLLDTAYDNYFEKSDGYAKYGEGTVTITGETYFERKNGRPGVQIEVYSYVFGTGRRQRFDNADAFLEWATKVHATEMVHDYSKNMWDDWDEDGNNDPV